MENNQQITISDLEELRQLIDLACTRGAFRASEASTVGRVYEKLTTFLTAVVEQAQAQEATKQVVPDAPDQTQGE
jgi:uncharacterized protein YdbL (DUF1318 family)